MSTRRPAPALVYRIMTAADWQVFVLAGRFAGSRDDQRDGFIHLSTADQVVATHEKHYRGIADLLLLEIDAGALGRALRYEPSRGGALFPHLYGALSLSAVTAVTALGGATA